MKTNQVTGREVILKELKEEFELSIMRDLIPGILHNFANPLNGILGRSKLMQRRVNENFQKVLDLREIDEDTLDGYKKILNDINLISRESDHFYDLFNDVANKFYRIGDTVLQRLNISELIESEMAFFQFYLDFKHNVSKRILLEKEIPKIVGAPADYSMCISTIVKHSMHSMKGGDQKEFVISTSYDDTHVLVTMKDTGIPITADMQKVLMGETSDFDTSINGFGESKGLFYALSLLKKYEAIVDFDHKENFNILSLKIPYEKPNL